MANSTTATWPIYFGRLPADKQKQAIQDLNRGVHVVTDDGGEPLEYGGASTHCETAPRFELSKD